VLIAQVVFLLEGRHTQTHKVTEATYHTSNASATTRVHHLEVAPTTLAQQTR